MMIIKGNSMSGKKRLIILTPNSPGIQRSHDLLCQYLSGRGVEINTKLDLSLKQKNINIYILPIHYYYILFILKILRFNVIFMCHGRSSLAHNGFLKHTALTFLTGLVEKISDHNIFVSKNTKGSAKGLIFHNIIRNKKYTLSVNNKTVYYFGRICKSKGVPEILKLAREISDFKFIFFGQIEKNYNSFQSELLGNNNCEYGGSYQNIAELKELVQPGSVFMSLNRNEPFGITYIEALELQLLPIVPEGAGVTDVMSGGVVINNKTNLSETLEEIFGKKFNIELKVDDDRDTIAEFFDTIRGRKA